MGKIPDDEGSEVLVAAASISDDRYAGMPFVVEGVTLGVPGGPNADSSALGCMEVEVPPAAVGCVHVDAETVVAVRRVDLVGGK